MDGRIPGKTAEQISNYLLQCHKQNHTAVIESYVFYKYII